MQIGKVAAVAVATVLGASAIGGCAAIEDRTGYGTRTQLATVGGAVGGGLIAVVAGASSPWIFLGTVLGGVAGGVASELLGDDAQQNAKAGVDALDNKAEGGQTEWRNPASGNGGTTTIDESYVTAEGVPCKRFTQTITADGQSHSITGTACRNDDGTWEVVAG